MPNGQARSCWRQWHGPCPTYRRSRVRATWRGGIPCRLQESLLSTVATRCLAWYRHGRAASMRVERLQDTPRVEVLWRSFLAQSNAAAYATHAHPTAKHRAGAIEKSTVYDIHATWVWLRPQASSQKQPNYSGSMEKAQGQHLAGAHIPRGCHHTHQPVATTKQNHPLWIQQV